VVRVARGVALGGGGAGMKGYVQGGGGGKRGEKFGTKGPRESDHGKFVFGERKRVAVKKEHIAGNGKSGANALEGGRGGGVGGGTPAKECVQPC